MPLRLARIDGMPQGLDGPDGNMPNSTDQQTTCAIKLVEMLNLGVIVDDGCQGSTTERLYGWGMQEDPSKNEQGDGQRCSAVGTREKEGFDLLSSQSLPPRYHEDNKRSSSALES
ncbi:hypothetical protein B0H13DRAFT_1865541 [Mycena leptocephala]|nr:hypothetical protein B0H13DRAFT_1865541 [Mycena leptocephala]